MAARLSSVVRWVYWRETYADNAISKAISDWVLASENTKSGIADALASSFSAIRLNHFRLRQ